MNDQATQPRLDGARIRALRKKYGLSAENLARKADVTTRHIWRLEAGQRPRASAVVLAQIALALNTTVEYLLGISDEVRFYRVREEASETND